MLRRNDEEFKVKVQPILAEDGKYKIGKVSKQGFEPKKDNQEDEKANPSVHKFA